MLIHASRPKSSPNTRHHRSLIVVAVIVTVILLLLAPGQLPNSKHSLGTSKEARYMLSGPRKLFDDEKCALDNLLQIDKMHGKSNKNWSCLLRESDGGVEWKGVAFLSRATVGLD